MDSLHGCQFRSLPTHLSAECLGLTHRHRDEGSEEESSDQHDAYLPYSVCEADDLDEEAERLEGERQEDELLQKYPTWEEPEAWSLLDRLLACVGPYCQRAHRDYRFMALDTPIPFASSCCHGVVFFSRGLLEHLSFKALEFFATHEVAHTELRHFASRERRLNKLCQSIPAPPASHARLRMQATAVLAVRHHEEFEADHWALVRLGQAEARDALVQLYGICQRLAPQSLTIPTHPSFKRRQAQLKQSMALCLDDCFWSLMSGTSGNLP